MKKFVAYFGLSLVVFGCQNMAYAGVVRAVIGTQNSQVVENLEPNQTPSLSVSAGSILPLTENFSPITQRQNSYFPQWEAQLGQPIEVISKLRTLSFKGKLVQLEGNQSRFRIDTGKQILSLPINDFYLASSVQDKKDKQPAHSGTNFPNAISYQTQDLFWAPKRTLIFHDGQVSVMNMAELHNPSSHEVLLESSLLHYSPQPVLRMNAVALKMSESAPVTPHYQDDEITYPVTKLALQPNANTLINLNQFTDKIDKSLHTASVRTALHSSGDLLLKFEHTLYFKLSEDALPGQYQTFWQRNGLLIPSNAVNLPSARANQSIQVVSNKSLDLTGTLSLVSTTSQKLPASQVWQLTLQNHSNETQDFQIEQILPGVLSSASDITMITKKATSVEIHGEIPQGKTLKLEYTVDLTN